MKNQVFYLAASAKSPEGGIYHYTICEGRPQQLGFKQLDGSGYLAFSPDRKFLYSTCIIGDGGGAAAFAIQDDKSLRFLNSMEARGRSSCYLCTDPSGKFLFTANYSSGNVSEFTLENGAIKALSQVVAHQGRGPNEQRQEGPHPHFAQMTPDGKYLCIVDLGIDAVVCYPVDPQRGLDAQAAKSSSIAPAGSGPRHLIFDRSGKIAYVANELGNTVLSMHYKDGSFTAIELQATLPETFTEPSKVAAIRLSQDEKFLFVSNRGYDSIAVYALDGQGGMRQTDLVLSGGSSPRDINFLPGGRKFAATNEFSNSIFFYDYDAASGKLTPDGNVIGTLPRPLCIHW
jgi:6-phosphogluconolactonase